MSIERIIGIDFGTSTSVIRVKRYNNGQPVDDRLSKQDVIFNGDSPVVPTLIQRTDKGTYYGYDALISKKGEILFQNFKVNLENPDPAQRREARALTEEFFAYMAKEYRSQSEGGHFGDSGDTERTIVSYPVKWSDETKTFMIKAAEKSGFKNVEGMDEAQAAIHAVTIQSEDYLTKHGFFMSGVPCNILLIDMGAGTTDLVLCRHTPGNPPQNEMICTWPKAGDTLFGGREVDEILREYISSLLPENMVPIVLRSNGVKEFKVWKETVVSPALQRNETVEEFSNIDTLADALGIDMEPYDLDRNKFKRQAEKYLQEFPRLIAGCIDNSGISKEDIDLVILTGGHSQWYFVKEMLSDSAKIDFPKIRQNPDRIIPITRPQETVALGMIYRPLSVEFQKACEPVVEEIKTEYEEDVQKETYINDLTIETNENRMDEYYRKNRGSLVIRHHIYGWFVVKPDGTIACDSSVRQIVDGWSNIASISCGTHIIGLRKDGTVVATGDNECGQCNVQDWRDIVSVSCGGGRYTVGLRKDGSVVATGDNECGQCNVQSWRDIVSISSGFSHTIGVRKDGTVVAIGNNEAGEWCNVQNWRDIVSTSCGVSHTVGLRKNGTVVATGNNYCGQCDVQNWRDIVNVSCGWEHTVGLRKDGTVIATGANDFGECNIHYWNDIVAVDAIQFYTYGIKGDGKIIYTDSEEYEPVLSKIFKQNSIKLVFQTKTLPWKLF